MATYYGKNLIASYKKNLDGEDFKVIIVDENKLCSDGDKYYNVHILCDTFNQDEMNTLKLQESHSAVENPKEYFDKKYMIGALMEHFIWDRFYDEGILSVGVKVYEIEEN